MTLEKSQMSQLSRKKSSRTGRNATARPAPISRSIGDCTSAAVAYESSSSSSESHARDDERRGGMAMAADSGAGGQQQRRAAATVSDRVLFCSSSSLSLLPALPRLSSSEYEAALRCMCCGMIVVRRHCGHWPSPTVP